MFEPGDNVVHIRHGVGVVLEKRTLTFEGKDRIYFCIQLHEARNILMIPEENVDEGELRFALIGTQLIEEVLQHAPDELSDNFRIRQSDIRDIIKSRNPRKLTQALRDLAWLELKHKLTNTDIHLRESVLTALARELALKPETSVRHAQVTIIGLVEQAMQVHLANHPELVSVS
jgi:RNA polymerase-interacting CarD/CdnL/TRCF family regulator